MADTAVVDQVDSLLEELGLSADGEAPAVSSPAANRGISSGPGAMRGMSSGPGAGRGLSSGPGAMGRGGFSSGPGAMSAGPGGMSGGGGGMMMSGPGGMAGGGGGMMMSSGGPGGMGMAGRGAGMAAPAGPAPLNVATHTPDGREVKFTSVPCASCLNPIIGRVVNAIDRSWHPECFVCQHCRQTFPDGSFVEHDGMPYCESDFDQLFGPKCAVCELPITDTCINAVGKQFHPDCFSCAMCSCSLKGKKFQEDDGEVYCLTCKAKKTKVIAPASQTCGKCKLPIHGEYIILEGLRYHPEHFRCMDCGCEMNAGNCMEYEGNLYCRPCYLKQLRNICHDCQKPIMGRSVTAMGHVWHPEHWRCFHCKEVFAGSTFHEKEGRPYCELHYYQLFGKVCFKCNSVIIGEGLSCYGKYYHPDHFVCSGCERPLGKEVYEFETKPLCKDCYENLPKEIRKRIEKKKKEEEKAAKEREKTAIKEAKAAAKAAKKGL